MEKFRLTELGKVATDLDQKGIDMMVAMAKYQKDAKQLLEQAVELKIIEEVMEGEESAVILEATRIVNEFLKTNAPK